MNRRGSEITTTQVILGVVAVLVLVSVIFAASGQFGKFTKYVNFFNINGSVSPAEEVNGFLRYNLLDGKLDYSEFGTEWQEIEDEKNIKLFGKEMSGSLLKAQVEGFYFGKSVRKDLEYDASLDAGAGALYPVKVRMNSILAQDSSLGKIVISVGVYESLTNDLRPMINYFVDYYGNNAQIINREGEISKISLMDSSDFQKELFSNALLWRDSILVGGDNPQDIKIEGRGFSVRKVEDYLVINLDEKD